MHVRFTFKTDGNLYWWTRQARAIWHGNRTEYIIYISYNVKWGRVYVDVNVNENVVDWFNLKDTLDNNYDRHDEHDAHDAHDVHDGHDDSKDVNDPNGRGDAAYDDKDGLVFNDVD